VDGKRLGEMQSEEWKRKRKGGCAKDQGEAAKEMQRNPDEERGDGIRESRKQW
jgi:hypothetical protein